tara:strand:+ start:703 stop:1383 length:681 start_codon:yes stop_codon:yes gene_type:complete
MENYEDMLPNENNFTLDTDLEWRKKRLGKVTGSTFGTFVKKDKKGGYTLSTSKACQSAIYKIAWEIILKDGNLSNGIERSNIYGKALSHGNDNESLAIEKYTETTGKKVVCPQDFVEYDSFIGGTPDGFIDDDGLIEVKCPYNGANHLESMITKKIYNPHYIYQVQGYLWITNRQWCDFVTYDPHLQPDLQLNVIRIERDEEIINGIKSVLKTVHEKVFQVVAKLV